MLCFVMSQCSIPTLTDMYIIIVLSKDDFFSTCSWFSIHELLYIHRYVYMSSSHLN